MVDHPFKTNPELGTLVARYIAATSIMELLVSVAFARAINDNGTATHAILHHFRNLSDRIAILQDTLRLRPESDSLRINILPLIPRMIACNSFRNKLAHGLYATEDDGTFTLMCWLTSKQRKPDISPISCPIIENELEKHNELNQKLQGLGFGVGLPLSLPEK